MNWLKRWLGVPKINILQRVKKIEIFNNLRDVLQHKISGQNDFSLNFNTKIVIEIS